MQPTPTHSISGAEAAALDSIDALLDDLTVDDVETIEAVSDIDDTAIEEIVEDVPVEIEAAAEPEVVEAVAEPAADAVDEMILDSDAAIDIEGALAREEAYSGATSAVDIDTTTAPEPAAPVKERKARTPSTGPKIGKDVTTLEPEVFQLLVSAPPEDPAANKAAVLALRPNQKKIAEKFDNLFLSLAAGKKPSTYVVDTFTVLANKGEANSADLIAALKADGYSDGTARSQVGQVMNLFATLKIAERNKSALKINPDSMLAEALKVLIAA